MRKTIIKNEIELQEIILFYGEKWKDQIMSEINEFPCIIISCFYF